MSVYDRLVWPDGVVEKLLASGERKRELIAYFGEQEYAELVPLAEAALRARIDPDDVVFLVPGIMGSQLGVLRSAPQPPNLLWIDPADFQGGALTELSLQSQLDIRPLGVVLYSYLRMKLHLTAASFTVRCFDYDWRRSIAHSGVRLAAAIAAAGSRRVGVVGHSMGGLVARYALSSLAGERSARAADFRVIALATPQRGSFAAVQALRGSYATVRRIAQLDPLHSADELVSRAFRTFPSLYEMLPDSCRRLESWPSSQPGPDPKLLEASRMVASLCEQPDERIRAIVGVGQPTVTGLAHDDDEFTYRITRHGDGTVPAPLAALAHQPVWYAPLPHSELPRDAAVAAAVSDLLRGGETRRLATQASPDAVQLRTWTDTELHATFTGKLDWAAMAPEQRRAFLDDLNSPMLQSPDAT